MTTIMVSDRQPRSREHKMADCRQVPRLKESKKARGTHSSSQRTRLPMSNVEGDSCHGSLHTHPSITAHNDQGQQETVFGASPDIESESELGSASVIAPAQIHSGESSDPVTNGSGQMSTHVYTDTEPLSATRKIGGWFSGMLGSSQQDAKLQGGIQNSTASVPLSPSKVDRRNNESLTPIHNTSGSPYIKQPSQQAGRMSGLDRMLDRAFQYFTDSDSHADKNQDDIWLLGVRHDGWRAVPQKVPPPEIRHTSSDDGMGASPRKANDSRHSTPQKVRKPLLSTKSSSKRRPSKSSLQGSSEVTSSDSPMSPLSVQHIDTHTSDASMSTSPSRSMSRGFMHALKPNNKRASSPTITASELLNSSSQEISRVSSTSSTASANRISREQQLSRESSRQSFSSSFSQDTSFVNPTPLQFEAPDPVFLPAFSSLTPEDTHGWPASFYVDFYSRIHLTYRSAFPPIPCSPNVGGSALNLFSNMVNNLNASMGRGQGQSQVFLQARNDGLSTDTGWGCMLRTGQSLLANALMDIHLGRDWRRPIPSSQSKAPRTVDYATYVRLLSWFFDDPSSLSPFSVHHFAEQGRLLGKNVGEWFGPSTAAGAIKNLVNAFPPANLGVVLAGDTTVYRSEVFATAGIPSTRRNPGLDLEFQRPVLILVPLRLGLNGVNPIYFKSIKHFFTLKQCVGIAGGRPSSSYYFIGSQSDNLFYIDPHQTKAALQPKSIPQALHQAAEESPLMQTAATVEETSKRLNSFYESSYTLEDLETFHCEKVRKMQISGLDPSMLVGLLCKSRADWEDLETRLKEFLGSIPKGEGLKTAPIINIVAEVPGWMRAPSRSISASGGSSKAGVPTLSSLHSASQKTGLGNMSTDAFAIDADPGESEVHPEDDSVNYADSDDWDIDDSDSNNGLNDSVESLRVMRTSASGMLETQVRKEDEEEDEWLQAEPQSSTTTLYQTHLRVEPQPEPSRRFTAESDKRNLSNSKSPPLRSDSPTESDAILVIPLTERMQPAGPQQISTHRNTREHELRKGRHNSLELDDKEAGWERLAIASPK